MWHVALESWQCIHQVAAPCNVIRNSGMTCHWIRPNVHHIGILYLVSSLTTSPQVDMSFYTSLQNFIQIGPPSAEKNDVMSIFKMANLSHLEFQGSNKGFFEKLNYITSYRSSTDTIALNRLVFEKKSHFCNLVTYRQTSKQTDRRTRRMKPLSLSRAAA